MDRQSDPFGRLPEPGEVVVESEGNPPVRAERLEQAVAVEKPAIERADLRSRGGNEAAIDEDRSCETPEGAHGDCAASRNARAFSRHSAYSWLAIESQTSAPPAM